MQNTLIIKTGAAGDVVRTTSLLNVLEGKVYWLVDPKNKGIFPEDFKGLQIITSRDLENSDIKNLRFKLVLSLEEDISCARIATELHTERMEGIFLDDRELNYSELSSGWYDMSLISKKGRVVANALKKSNPFPFQHWLFSMMGKAFSDQPYIIYRNSSIRRIKGLVGIESRVGETWPNKNWSGYESLERIIRSMGYDVRRFEQRENIRDYFDDIASCSCIICGDSLSMHVAMAYQIPTIALFNCTPPNEIHDYGVLRKLVSPLLHSNLYSKGYNEEVVRSIAVEEVVEVFKNLALSK
jgi:heptosyltransferase-2